MINPQQTSDQISRSVVSNSLRPHESQHARPPCPSPTPGVHSDSPSVHGNSPGKNTGVGFPCLPPRDLPNPGIKPRSPTLQADSLLSEPLDIMVPQKMGSAVELWAGWVPNQLGDVVPLIIFQQRGEPGSQGDGTGPRAAPGQAQVRQLPGSSSFSEPCPRLALTFILLVVPSSSTTGPHLTRKRK